MYYKTCIHTHVVYGAAVLALKGNNSILYNRVMHSPVNDEMLMAGRQGNAHCGLGKCLCNNG